MENIVSKIEGLNRILRSIKDEYGHRLIIRVSNDIPNSDIEFDHVFPVIPIVLPVYMNVKADKNHMTDFDFVKVVKNVFHEKRHLEQHFSMFSNKNASEHVRDMAKVLHIGHVIPEYEKIVYFINPCEIDAEYYGWINTVKYFNEHPEYHIDVKSELLNDIHARIDHHFGWFGDRYSVTYDDALFSLTANRFRYRDIRPQILPFGDVISKGLDCFMRSGGYVKYMNAKPEDAFDILYEHAYRQKKQSTWHYPCLGRKAVSVDRGKLAEDRLLSNIVFENQDERQSQMY